MRPRVLIIGFGLMGGSAGLALRARGWHVAYLDARVPFAGKARDAADEKLDASRADDVVLLATHVDDAVAWLPKLETRGVITSLCSVMQPLRAVAPQNFVAGHPIAGSHRSGIENARADLYVDKTWFLDAHDARVEQLVRDCGAIAKFTTAAEHDAAIALTSHLPQVLSTALAAYLSDKDVLEFAGPGLRDFLRLAGSNVEMWGPILDANRENLAPHADALAALLREIVTGDPREAFAKAHAMFEALHRIED
jgi:prephenate dehydrogenase